MKILISRAAKANTANVNGVLYSEDLLRKSLEEKINNSGPIPVTLQGPYYGLWKTEEFASVNESDVIGYINSLDDIHDTCIYVHIKDSLEPKNITKIIDKVRSGYKLGLRYFAEVKKMHENDELKYIKDGTMQIICYDLINVEVVD